MTGECATALRRRVIDHRLDACRRRRDIHRRRVVEQQIEIDVRRQACLRRRRAGYRGCRIAENSHEQVGLRRRVVDDGGAAGRRIRHCGGHVADDDIRDIDGFGIEGGLRGGLRRGGRAGDGLVIDRGERCRIGHRVELRFRHIGGAVIDTCTDGKDERDRRQAHHDGHAAAIVAAEATHLAHRVDQQANDIRHRTKPLRLRLHLLK